MTEQIQAHYFLSLRELTISFGVATEVIIEIIDQGIVAPVPDENERWLFDSFAIRRVRAALQLQRDLGVNLAGAGLALDLLDQIDSLQAQLALIHSTRGARD